MMILQHTNITNIDTKSFSNSFEGARTWGCEKIKGDPLSSCFIVFLWQNISKSFEGVHEVPSPPPFCIYDNKIKPDSEEGWLFSGRACLRLHLERVDVAETEHGGGDAPRQAGDGANGHHEADDQHVQVVAAAFLLKIKSFEILSLGEYDQHHEVSSVRKTFFIEQTSNWPKLNVLT